MATKYTLTYYSAKGIAEPIRFLLAYGRADWKDVRVETVDFPAIKQSMPFGRVPVLEFEDKKVHQSIAICRYLGKQYKLAGENDFDALQIDVLADTLMDFRGLCQEYLLKNFFGEKPEVLKKLKEPIMTEVVPYYFTKFENQVKSNDGYFLNGKLTWVDLFWAAHSDNWEGHFKGIMEPYPNLRALQKKVFDLPGIKEWVEKRPKE